MYLQGKPKKAYRWTNKIKNVSLQIKQSSTKTYRLMKSIFKLPNLATISRLISNVDVHEGFHDSILEGLKSRADKSKPMDRYVVLAFDEMQLVPQMVYNQKLDKVEGVDKHSDQPIPVTNYAGVFMVRGLASNFTQPIGYFLSCGAMKGPRLADLIKEAILKVNNAGMHVIAFVMDNGPNNVSAVKSMKITDDTISVAGKKTFVFVDTPHLVKNTRGNLSKNGFVDDEGVKVNWGYIQTLESINSSHFPRYCPRLTYHHVNLQPFKEMNVSKAAQVLSHSVSVGLNMLVDQGKLPVAARNTARFCKIFDNLFDTFNSSSMYSPKALKCALSNDSKHWKFLDEAEDYILKLEHQGKHSELPTIQGWLRNIRSLRLLFTEVKSDMKYVLTRRISQDMLEHFFARVRARGGNRDTHSAQQFRFAYRAACLDKLKYTIAGTNCSSEDTDTGDSEAIDQDELYTNLLKITRKQEYRPISIRPGNQPHTSNDPLHMLAELCQRAPKLNDKSNSDHSYQDPVTTKSDMENQTIFYMAGMLSKKALRNIQCEECVTKVLIDKDIADDSCKVFTEAKLYDGVSRGLAFASSPAYSALQVMDEVLKKNVEYLLYTENVSASLTRLMLSAVQIQVGCPTHNHVILQRMASTYSRIWIYETLKKKNKTVKSTQKGKRKNRKYCKLVSAQIRQPEA